MDGASTSNWEVARLDTSGMGVYRRILKVTAGEEYWTDADGQALLLEDFDAVFIPFNPKFSHGQSVRVTGYVMYPGTYTLRHEEERLVDIVARAGGLRDGAYLEGSRLFREYSDAGLVPLDFASALTDSTSLDNIVLYDGDSIYVSRTEEVVYVSGEVYVPSPVLYKEGASLSYYIYQAGDYTQEAEDGKTVVFLPGGKKWDGGEIPPGSRIFVPREIEKENKMLPFLRDTLAILAALAAITVSVVAISR
ncbi:MAG: SLBB domain-containing protein [Bacteroidota bacterium]